MEKITKLPQIVSLNFGFTNIILQSASYIKKADKLKALHVGSTKIKGSQLVDMVQELKGLRKLSLRGFNP